MEFHVPQDRIRIFIPGFDSNPPIGLEGLQPSMLRPPRGGLVEVEVDRGLTIIHHFQNDASTPTLLDEIWCVYM